MDAARVHPTAVVEDGVQLEDGVEIGPYAVIRTGTILGAGTRVGAHAVVGPNARLGRGNRVFSHASVGADPQDLSYRGEETWLVMGDGNTVRESVTINRGTSKGDGVTRIGHGCLFMACCHVAHDCRIGDGVILANNVLLAGHVVVQDHAILNGAAGVQQFATIGRFAYVGGLSRIVHDVAPFMVVEGHPSRVRKVNSVGLQRGGFTQAQIEALREAHRLLFRSKRPKAEVIAELDGAPGATPEVQELCEFLRRMERGRAGRAQEA
jgi:UDP-N-acetylglucosamine acyltransferase